MNFFKVDFFFHFPFFLLIKFFAGFDEKGSERERKKMETLTLIN